MRTKTNKKVELQDLIKNILLQKDIAEEAIELNRKIYWQGGKTIEEYLKILGEWRLEINCLRLDYNKYDDKLKQM